MNYSSNNFEYEYLVFIVLCCCILSTNSRSSTIWRLSSDETKIIEGNSLGYIYKSTNESHQLVEDDLIFNIISSTVHFGESWIKGDERDVCTNCHNLQNTLIRSKVNNTHSYNSKVTMSTEEEEPLDCGKPVNFTYYDNLVGVQNRHRHPIVPESHATVVFSKYDHRKMKTVDFDVNALERRLKKAKREKPKSVQLYNQIGNYFRIKGDALRSIECFRRALAVTPHNSAVLLNLARVLFSLQYLDDAIYLTRRSLELQPPDKGVWQQYFTLGEIFKAYGHYQEAIKNLKHTLELKPGFLPAQLALKEMEALPSSTLHIYTLIIIICLVMGVLLVILSSMDSIAENDYTEVKPQRHFNKAMAMRSLRGLTMTQKISKIKK